MSAQPDTITIIQYNTHKSKDKVMAEFLYRVEAAEDQPLVLAIQEPWRSTRGPHTTKTTPSYHLNYLDHAETRVCFYVHKNLDPTRWSVEHHSPDLSTLSIQAGGREIRIHNIYNPRPHGHIHTLPNLLTSNAEHVLLGDFNLHHPLWGGVAVVAPEDEADDLIRFTEAAGLEIATECGVETWARGNQKQTLDLTFITGWVLDRLTTCERQDRWFTDSDHYPIFTEIDVRPPLQQEPTRRPLWKAADWPQVRTALGEELIALAGARMETHEDLDKFAGYLHKTIQKVIRHEIPVAKPSPRARPEWNADCTEVVRETQRLRRVWQDTRLEEDWVLYRQQANAKARVIRKAKQKDWRQAVAKITADPKGVWRMARWAKTTSTEARAPPQFPPIARPGEEVYHSNNEDKAIVLAEQFFPEPAPADLSDLADYIYPEPQEVTADVEPGDVIAALKGLAPDKAPGPTKITNRFLKQCGAELAPTLARLFTRRIV